MPAETMLLALMLAATFAVLLSGVPAALALGGVPLVFAFLAGMGGMFDTSLLLAFPARALGVFTNPLLMAIPFFVLMSAALDRSGIAARMLAALHALAGGSPRGLMLGVLAASVLLAASTGVIGATVVMLATLAMPGLLRAGVSRREAAGLVCAGGSLGQIVPPAILLVVLADQVSNAHVRGQTIAGNLAVTPVSASAVFAAALLPGLLLATLYGLRIAWRVTGDRRDTPRLGLPEALTGVGAPALLVVCVLGSVLAGLATPTESAVAGAVAALAMAALAAPKPGWLAEALADTVRLTGAIFTILIAASLFSLIVRGFGGDELVGRLAAIDGGATAMLLAVMVAVFLLGFVLEFVEIVAIVVPLAGPLLFASGVDPIWFAALMALNLQTSFLTPPFGLALFYFRSVEQAIPPRELFAGVAPYVALQLLALALVFAFPPLATWLPGALGL
jgi:tripartite ATP-independent transporter DctM subunit